MEIPNLEVNTRTAAAANSGNDCLVKLIEKTLRS